MYDSKQDLLRQVLAQCEEIEATTDALCLLDEALEKIAECALDLASGIAREALARPLGLACPERTHQRHFAAALHRDDSGVATASNVELDRSQVLVVGPDRAVMFD